MPYYITKYALTAGIETVSEDDFKITEHGSLYGKRPGEYSQSFQRKDWHFSFIHAQERAEEMRAAKLKSLAKQIKKLEAMSFAAKEQEKQNG